MVAIDKPYPYYTKQQVLFWQQLSDKYNNLGDK